MKIPRNVLQKCINVSVWGDLHLFVRCGQSFLLTKLGWCWILSRVTPALTCNQKSPIPTSHFLRKMTLLKCCQPETISARLFAYGIWPKLSHLRFPKWKDLALPTNIFLHLQSRSCLVACVGNRFRSNSWVNLIFFFALKLPTGNEQRSLPLKHLGTLLIQGLHCAERETQPANTEQLAIDLDY